MASKESRVEDAKGAATAYAVACTHDAREAGRHRAEMERCWSQFMLALDALYDQGVEDAQMDAEEEEEFDE